MQEKTTMVEFLSPACILEKLFQLINLELLWVIVKCLRG